jgi:hypothetical protein
LIPAPLGTPLYDVDAYQVEVTTPTRFHFCVVAEFAPLIGLVVHDDSCRTFTVLDTATGLACDTVCIDTCVPPGVYDFYVVPWLAQNNAIACQHYVAHLSCEPCCRSTEAALFDAGQFPQCECVHLCAGTTVPIRVCGRTASPSRPPILTITPGCSTPGTPDDHCNVICDPIPSGGFFYDPTGWVWNDSLHCWLNFLVGNAEGCLCVCLDGYLAVELQSFTAAASDGKVTLNWQTASERDNDHFEVMRDGHPAVTNVRATNNPTGAHYSWTDRDLQNGQTYSYQLVAVDMGGERTTLASTEATPVGRTAEIITEYALRQNYPNPFNPKTSISFDLVDNGFVKLTIYNPMGQQVASVVSGEMPAGRHTVTFDASDLPSGMYLYRLEVNGFSAVRKMLLMK